MTLPINNYLRVKLLDIARGTSQLKSLNRLISNQFEMSAEQIDLYQRERFNTIFQHHYTHNPRYKKFITNRGIQKKPWVNLRDVPLIDKDFFRDNIHDHFISEEVNVSKFSGGSTGVPMPVHLSKTAIDHFWPSIWRGFDVLNILPCDKMMMIAGTSLFNNRSLKRRVYDRINQFETVSAYDLNDVTMERAYKTLKRKRIKAIYGYTSSIFTFLQFMKLNKYSVDLKGIFTTSETFIPALRTMAAKYCNCDVIDLYGANDGGVFGFECEHHKGYHLNYERCLVEITNDEILLTDLQNTASPFIRYKVGDRTESTQLLRDRCSCGRTLFRLNDISGKTNQFFQDLDGTKIHSGFFTQLFKSDNRIKQYQITDFGSRLIINFIYDENISIEEFTANYREQISKKIQMPFEFVRNQPIKTLPNMKTPIIYQDH